MEGETNGKKIEKIENAESLEAVERKRELYFIKYNDEGEYTNADVIDAVENVTGNRVTEKIGSVKTRNGNDIDISDLWVKNVELSEIKPGQKISKKSEYIEKDTGYKITIPAGYTIHNDSAINISDGIVIVDDDDENEFVWVPVPNAIAET